MLLNYWPHLTVFGIIDACIVAIGIPWVLLTKRDSTAAIAWSLAIFLLPLVGFFLFWVFGFNHINRRLGRKRAHRRAFREAQPPRVPEAARGNPQESADETFAGLGQLAVKLGGFPVSGGNSVTLYADTKEAMKSLLDAIAGARHSIHLEFFIFRPDETGKHVIDLLARKAAEGVQVRLLRDAMGGHDLGSIAHRAVLEPLLRAGGKANVFLPLSPWRSRVQVNLRNHRKMVVVDGRVGFTGGMNIGDEYLGKGARFGYWRDEFVRLEGPAVAALQRTFAEDWDFACGESLDDPAYYPDAAQAGEDVVQVVESGPDQDVNTIRELYFAAILAARERLWIASPYFVPDAGLLDALRLACHRGVDVRLLSLLRPDHFFSFYAGRYYYTDFLAARAKVYQYRKGMMHAKSVMVDGRWAFVGSSNLDNRSLHLNFEAGVVLHSSERVAELEKQFQQDLRDSEMLELPAFMRRPFRARLTENTCRLLSPIL